eukprot:m.29273 g.29273  ORF g.29273 m.29273 type:complete len:396 (+) comp4580_c0_seq1:881-2068(+)
MVSSSRCCAKAIKRTRFLLSEPCLCYSRVRATSGQCASCASRHAPSDLCRNGNSPCMFCTISFVNLSVKHGPFDVHAAFVGAVAGRDTGDRATGSGSAGPIGPTAPAHVHKGSHRWSSHTGRLVPQSATTVTADETRRGDMATTNAEATSDDKPASTAPALKTFSFKTPKLNSVAGTSAPGSAGAAGAKAVPDDPEAEVDIKVTPLVKLQPVKLPTGEEDEDVILEVRAKMFVWGEGNAGVQWKERGVGPVKLLKHKETGLTRLLMRRDQTLKMCANHRLGKEMRLDNKMGSDRAWAYSCFADYSDAPEVKRITCALRFKNKEIAESFSTKFNEARDANVEILSKDGGESGAVEDAGESGSSSSPTKQEGNADAAVDALAEGMDKLGTKTEDTAE